VSAAPTHAVVKARMKRVITLPVERCHDYATNTFSRIVRARFAMWNRSQALYAAVNADDLRQA
jgi:hypothetical protein